jgi:hypothetical protein
MRLTDASRKLTLPTGKTETIFFDDDVPGFGIRLRAADMGLSVLRSVRSSDARRSGAHRQHPSARPVRKP